MPDPKAETAAIDALTESLRGKLEQEAASSSGASYVAYLVPGTFAVRSTSREPDGEQVKITVEGSAKATAVSRQALADEIAADVLPGYARGTGATIDDWTAVRGVPEGADAPAFLALSGTVGAVLDPIVSLRQRIRLGPGGFLRMSYSTGMADGRETALALAQKYRDPGAVARTFALAFVHAQSGLRHLGITSEEARLFERLASRVLHADGSLRAALTKRSNRRSLLVGSTAVMPRQ